MSLRIYLTTLFIKIVLRIICRVDTKELKKVSESGPVIICINHINFLEAPIIQTHLLKRGLRGFAKKETWNHPVLRFLANTYRAIPVDRGGANISAFHEIKETLKEGKIICVAPEGTRSRSGILQEGKSGITLMAHMTGAPIQPVVFVGSEKFWKNLKHFRRTKIKIRVGRPFYLKVEKKADSKIRKKMTGEIMYQMADLLPESLRGSYSDPSEQSTEYLEFMD